MLFFVFSPVALFHFFLCTQLISCQKIHLKRKKEMIERVKNHHRNRRYLNNRQPVLMAPPLHMPLRLDHQFQHICMDMECLGCQCKCKCQCPECVCPCRGCLECQCRCLDIPLLCMGMECLGPRCIQVIQCRHRVFPTDNRIRGEAYYAMMSV